MPKKRFICFWKEDNPPCRRGCSSLVRYLLRGHGLLCQVSWAAFSCRPSFSPFIYNMVYPYSSPFHPVRESPCKTALKTSVLRKSSSKTSKKVLAKFAVKEKVRTFAPAFGNGSGAPWEVLKKLAGKFGGKAGKSLSLHPLSEKKEGRTKKSSMTSLT